MFVHHGVWGPLVLDTHWRFIHIGTFFKGRPDAPETHTLLFPHTESQPDARQGTFLGDAPRDYTRHSAIRVRVNY